MLTDAGVALIPRGADRVELSYADARVTLTVVASPTPLSPRDIAALVSRHPEPCLIIVPAATPAVQEAVEAAGWSWLAESGQAITGVLRIGGERIALQPQAEAAKRSAKRGPVPWGTFTLVRRMVQRPYTTQQELAALVGVSQPRVSQALRTLADQDVVQRTSSGWTVRKLDEAIRWWLENYPGPGGISTYWYGLASAVEQARTVVEMVAAGDSHGVAVSGDVAADIIAPWRAPTRAILYATTGVNLADTGFIPSGVEEATLEFTVPRDPGLWQPSGMAVPATPNLPLADPLQILWDVRRSPGSDSEEAAQRVWDVLRRDHRDRGYAA
ncbi:winged helix-turn-helix transcriptional regulator [Micromonospora thermarum]|uniref:Helix-turn-helix domain-containing protein n=1 Tax=Micromonospora thermarum TaxID=2720024 RepID=A0ABX0Z7J7_9ACTN|nr:winged helix-turn-helix transcriptional regulator [Micromonospora thermarum]NJP32033.1 helix-turn-helix domain-containing protein [Micromonospora thermarum]